MRAAVLALALVACSHPPVRQASSPPLLADYTGKLGRCPWGVQVINSQAELPDPECVPRGSNTTGAIDWATQSLVILGTTQNVSVAFSERHGSELELILSAGCRGAEPPPMTLGFLVPKIATAKTVDSAPHGACGKVP
jgi:hypothetical protein